MQLSTDQTKQYNALVDKWGFKTRMQLKNSISRLSMKGKRELVTKLQYKTKKDFGETEAVIFSFPRHGVFFHKGVGRGYIMMNGTVIRGQRKDKTSHGKNTEKNTMFSAVTVPLKRKPKDWFNPVFKTAIPQLADIIATTKADQIFEVKHLKLNT